MDYFGIGNEIPVKKVYVDTKGKDNVLSEAIQQFGGIKYTKFITYSFTKERDMLILFFTTEQVKDEISQQLSLFDVNKVKA